MVICGVVFILFSKFVVVFITPEEATALIEMYYALILL